ncbi:MAG TPA: hypothetical protein VK694_01450 [Verrucomicrobiae bacterium]|nr:hypothetical protein [Verrucomicrobiae bacterium]
MDETTPSPDPTSPVFSGDPAPYPNPEGAGAFVSAETVAAQVLDQGGGIPEFAAALRQAQTDAPDLPETGLTLETHDRLSEQEVRLSGLATAYTKRMYGGKGAEHDASKAQLEKTARTLAKEAIAKGEEIIEQAAATISTRLDELVAIMPEGVEIPPQDDGWALRDLAKKVELPPLKIVGDTLPGSGRSPLEMDGDQPSSEALAAQDGIAFARLGSALLSYKHSGGDTSWLRAGISELQERTHMALPDRYSVLDNIGNPETLHTIKSNMLDVMIDDQVDQGSEKAELFGRVAAIAAQKHADRERIRSFESLDQAPLWSAEIALPAIGADQAIEEIFNLSQETKKPILGYYIDNGDGTARFLMSRFPEHRDIRPPMLTDEECDEVAETVADRLDGIRIPPEHTETTTNFRAVIGLLRGGYDQSAEIQPISKVEDVIGSQGTVTAGHMIDSQFEKDDTGKFVQRTHNEPVAIVETDNLYSIAHAGDELEQQHVPVELVATEYFVDVDGVKKGTIILNETPWADEQNAQ